MSSSLGSGNHGSSSWRLFAPFKMNFHLCYLTESLYGRRVQVMPVRGHSRAVYGARLGVKGDTIVDACIKR